MKLIVCIDDRGGMLFNHRRQSSDRMVTEKILQLTKDQRLLVDPYTRKLFAPEASVVSTTAMSEVAGAGDWCFVENLDTALFLMQTEELVLFRWNRLYPADLYFPVEALNKGWTRTHREDFPGNSHEHITMEVYRR